MVFGDVERRQYREYADAAEYFFDQGDERMAVDALRDAVSAAGFDASVLTDQELLWVLNECQSGVGEFRRCHLPADPWFLRVIVRRLPDEKILEKRK